jgi:hypothetical protein
MAIYSIEVRPPLVVPLSHADARAEAHLREVIEAAFANRSAQHIRPGTRRAFSPNGVKGEVVVIAHADGSGIVIESSRRGRFQRFLDTFRRIKREEFEIRRYKMPDPYLEFQIGTTFQEMVLEPLLEMGIVGTPIGLAQEVKAVIVYKQDGNETPANSDLPAWGCCIK